MENLGELKTLYRLQSPSCDMQYTKRDLPVKRVLISGVGKIQFNPDSRQYVYFSKTDKHHVYYVFNKIFKMVAEEINNANMASVILPGHSQIIINDFYNSMNKSVLKSIKDFLIDYAPSNSVEVVSLSYLSSFYNFFSECAILNKKKQADHVPEVSDTHFYGGAFGVNDAWLDLLRQCTVQTSSSVVYLQDFFDFIIRHQQQFTSIRKTVKAYLTQNPQFMNLVDHLKWKTLSNPDFYDKNNSNSMRKALSTIFEERQYNPDKNLSRRDFLRVKQELKSEIELVRE